MSHRCAHEDCGFHLPDKYPNDSCPWHMNTDDDDGDGKAKVVAVTAVGAGLGLLALGYVARSAVESWKQVKQRRAVLQAQEWWRQKKRPAPTSSAPATPARSDSHTDAA